MNQLTEFLFEQPACTAAGRALDTMLSAIGEASERVVTIDIDSRYYGLIRHQRHPSVCRPKTSYCSVFRAGIGFAYFTYKGESVSPAEQVFPSAP